MDMFHVGVLAYWLLTGEPLFPAVLDAPSVEALLAGEWKFSFEAEASIIASVPRELRHLVECMLSR